ncbi:MAG: ATP-binding protein [Microthrixaceae bacterium]
MSVRDRVPELIGRDPQLARLAGWFEQLSTGQRPMALVGGEAGIGKTSLIRAAVAEASRQGARVAWGTCIDADGVPGFWPWTQALDGLAREVGLDVAARAAGEDAALLASIIPSFGAPANGETSARDRLLLMDAIGRFLDATAETTPTIVVLDDLQWADESSVALLEHLARSPRHGPVALLAAYRNDELPGPLRARVADLVTRAEHVELAGLDARSVATLVEQIAGAPIDVDRAASIHERTGGHPFFVRELALMSGTDGATQVPVAVRDAIDRRIARLPEPTVAVLEVVALLGTVLLPDVVAATLGMTIADVEAAAASAASASVLTRRDTGFVFVHDLLRETVDERVIGRRRTELHQAIGEALEARRGRGGEVAPADIARHFLKAVPIDGPDRATAWALEAAKADLATLAFAEAADHLCRLRVALADAAVALDDQRLVDLLASEASAQARAGNAVEARGLLRHAADVADRCGDAVRVAQVALATASLGATFAARRDDTVRRLDRALVLVGEVDARWEARVAATLARELQHSVPEDRSRAGSLSEHALEVGRRSGDKATLLVCLLARHDVLWTPGAGTDREVVAREIISVARSLGDDEAHAQGLLLLANALLEQGSPAYEAALESCVAILGSLGQPRHRYTAATRRACIALLQGRHDEAEQLIEEAAALGARIREPDADNVRMSQRLELVRASGHAAQLREFAAEAVEHWTGTPVHAHGVAAGFLARAGDVEAARKHVEAVADLGTWRADRSYLWSVFVRELAHAAVILEDEQLAAELLDDVAPLAATCGVNGAVVAFAGSHAHTAGVLAGALGDEATSRALLEAAASTYRSLGAASWLAELGAPAAPRAAGPTAAIGAMTRNGPTWQVAFAGASVSVPHTKGLADIARLLASPDNDIHVLALIDAVDRSGTGGEMADRRSLAAYRERVADLDEEMEEADRHHDPERHARAAIEREAILDELARVTGPGGRARPFANHPAERARKAVSGRIRDAIRKLEPVLPELADHLERTIVTGAYCRYRAEGGHWHVER